MASALGGLAAMSVGPAHAEPLVESATHETETYEKAREHQRLGQLEQALATLSEVSEPGVDTLLLRGRLLRSLGRFAAARTAFAIAWPRIHDPDRVMVVAREMDDLAERTAKLALTVYPLRDTTILVDGERIGVTPLPHELFVDPGHHAITAQHAGYPPVVREIDVAGGAELTVDLMVTEPQVCLSMLPPNYEGARAGLHWGVGIAPHVLLNLVREGGSPLFGAALTSGLSVGMTPFSFHAGPVGAVYASARGTSAMGGVRLESRVHPLDFLAIGLGTTAGYLYVPDEPEPAERDGFPGLRTTASFCVMPDAGFTLTIGPIEAGPRIGVTLSRAEQDGRGRFGPTYLSTMMWITYMHFGDPYAYD